MEDSRYDMNNEEAGHVGDADSISTNPSIPENSDFEDGWSEDEFDVRTHNLSLLFFYSC